MNITDNWYGWFINYLVDDRHPNFEDPSSNPNNVDWERDLAPGISLSSDRPVDIKFLWAYKVWQLKNNPESEARESLPEPIPIVLGKYHYGSFEGIFPKKQDLVLCGFYKETPESEIVIKPYKTLHQDLNKIGEREKLARLRRNLAENYIKHRARDIDLATTQLFEKLGEQEAGDRGLKRLDLSKGIEYFFEHFVSEMTTYEKTGSLKIINAIEEKTSGMIQESELTWLKEDILLGVNEDGSFQLVPAATIIAQLLQVAIAPVSQLEINAEVAKYQQLR